MPVFEVPVRGAVSCGGGGIWVAGYPEWPRRTWQPQIELQFRLTASRSSRTDISLTASRSGLSVFNAVGRIFRIGFSGVFWLRGGATI